MENSLPSRITGGDIGLCLSIIDLPTPIVVDILLQLSVENIINCKCVCKDWYKIISDPQFVKLYFPITNVQLLVRPVHRSYVSRTLYLVDPKYYMCESSPKMSLQTKYKIPLRNSEMLFESGMKRKRCLELKPEDHKFSLINSCKGFFCLSNRSTIHVCNPVTGEYVNLPTTNVPGWLGLGLGFSPKSNSFKIIRMFDHSAAKWWTTPPTKRRFRSYSSKAEIQILGTQSWKDIGLAPHPMNLYFPTFLNGTLNWVFAVRRPKFIVSFDFDNHRFKTFSLPPRASGVNMREKMRIGVLKDKLCYSNATKDEFLCIWVMSEYGVEETWTKICSVHLSGDQAAWSTGFYQPISQLENGAILLFHKKVSKKTGLIYYEPEKHILKYFRFEGISASFEAIGFTPSFSLLKDALAGNEVEVLNVKSRCAELKIAEENITPFLVRTL